MQINKNLDPKYYGFNKAIEKYRTVDANYEFAKRNSKYKKEQHKNEKQPLNNSKLYKVAKDYENNGGSVFTYMEEGLTYFNVDVNALNYTDLITYVLTKELGKTNVDKKFVKDCVKCLEQKKAYNEKINSINRQNNTVKKDSKKQAIEKFSSTFPTEVLEVALIADALTSNLYKNNDRDQENYLIPKAKDIVTYSMATSEETKLTTINNQKIVFDENALNLVNSTLKTNFVRIKTQDSQLNKAEYNDALIAEANLEVNDLSDNFYVLSNPDSSSKRISFLTEDNKNSMVMNLGTHLPASIISFPAKYKNVETNYNQAFDQAKKDLKEKYPNINIEIKEEKANNISSHYYDSKKQVNVIINPTEKTDSNENTMPKDIIKTIFQAERAYNEVSAKDVNKTLNIVNKVKINRKGEEVLRRRGGDSKAYKASKKDLKIKNKNLKSIVKLENGYEPLIQRAIALGSTMNTLKLNKYFNQSELKASLLYLQSQFNKTMALMADNKADWLVPYITEKIAQSFEREVSAKKLSKEQVINRFKENGLEVEADSITRVRQLAFAKHKEELQNVKTNTKTEEKEVVLEKEAEKETEKQQPKQMDAETEKELSNENSLLAKQIKKNVKEAKKQEKMAKKQEKAEKEAKKKEQQKEETKQQEKQQEAEKEKSAEDTLLAKQIKKKVAELKKMEEQNKAFYKSIQDLPEYKKAKVKLDRIILKDKSAEEIKDINKKIEQKAKVQKENADVVKEENKPQTEPEKKLSFTAKPLENKNKREYQKMPIQSNKNKQTETTNQQKVEEVKQNSQTEKTAETKPAENKIIQNKVALKELDDKTIKALIQNKLVKMICEERNKVTIKIAKKTKQLVDTKKLEEANSAFTLTSLFEDIFKDAYDKKADKYAAKKQQLAEKDPENETEVIQKQAVQLSDKYIELVKELTESIYESVEKINKEEKDLIQKGELAQEKITPISRVVSSLIRDERNIMQIRIIEDINEYYKVAIRKPQAKSKQAEEKQIEE